MRSAHRAAIAVGMTLTVCAPGVNVARAAAAVSAAEGQPAFGPVTSGSVTHSWTVVGRRTHVDSLKVDRISPANATVTVLCHGGGCPFKKKSVKPSRGHASLARLFRGHRLRAGGNVTVIVVAPRTTGRYVSFDIRPTAVPKLKAGCSSPGSLSPVGCPGPVGPQGPAGSAGAPGSAGPAGPSDVYVSVGAMTALPGAANAPLTVATLDNVPAGNYLLTATAESADFTNSASIVSCYVRVNGQVVASAAAVIGAGAGSTRASVLSTSTGATQSNPFRVTLECQTNTALAAPPTIENQHLTALRVGNVHAS